MNIVFGNNVYLRPVTVDDAEMWYEFYSDNTVNKYLFLNKCPLTKEEAKNRFLKTYIEKDQYPEEVKMAVVKKDDQRLVGFVALYVLDWRNRTAELGIFIMQGETSKGYGKEAMQLLMKWYFEHLGFNRLMLQVYTEHKVAINLYEKLGFTREGVFREFIYERGKYNDVLNMSILKAEYLRGVTV